MTPWYETEFVEAAPSDGVDVTIRCAHATEQGMCRRRAASADQKTGRVQDEFVMKPRKSEILKWAGPSSLPSNSRWVRW
jgi:hypothetical protein